MKEGEKEEREKKKEERQKYRKKEEKKTKQAVCARENECSQETRYPPPTIPENAKRAFPFLPPPLLLPSPISCSIFLPYQRRRIIPLVTSPGPLTPSERGKLKKKKQDRSEMATIPARPASQKGSRENQAKRDKKGTLPAFNEPGAKTLAAPLPRLRPRASEPIRREKGGSRLEARALLMVWGLPHRDRPVP